MRKIKWLACMVLLCGGLSALFPCDVSFERAKIVEKGKNKVQVKILLEIVHGNCPLNIEKTGLVFTGVKVEKREQWKKIDDYTWQLELKVALNENKPGEIRVVRDCPKRGLHLETLKLDPL